MIRALFAWLTAGIDEILESTFPSAKEGVKFPDARVTRAEALAWPHQECHALTLPEAEHAAHCLREGTCPNCGDQTALNLDLTLGEPTPVGVYECPNCGRRYRYDPRSGEASEKGWNVELCSVELCRAR